ncbi:IS110 family transposase [Paenibacillus larvae]|uniref:transposase n=1 Tax=Paenibacillus larvae TaxID=1464 RepID=UPI00227FBADD|nr:transposase [Paenibacillus larvae]MCY9720836.1 IS110 family transposase [Paenibacillus larvae]
MFSRQLQDIMTQVEQLLKQIPGTEEMLTIPGVAIVTLDGFLAEVGDLRGYEHRQQIIRLAGFHLKENSSGKKKSKSTITKRERSRLRALLFRAVLPMVGKNAQFKALHQYYTKRSHNPLKKKQSIARVMWKTYSCTLHIGYKMYTL